MGKKLVNGLSFLRFPLTVLIIFVHTYSYTRDAAGISGLGEHLCRILYIATKMTGFVPCFYIMSGFFFFLNIDKFTSESYKVKISRRIKSLVIPYFLWNLIVFAVMASKELITGNPMIPGGLLNLKSFVTSFFLFNNDTTPIDAPMWYVRDLIIVVFLTPLIYKAIKHFPLIYFIVLVTLFFINSELPLYKYYPAQAYISILFFSFGAYLSINKLHHKIPSISNSFIIVAALIFLAALYVSLAVSQGAIFKFTTHIVGPLITITIGIRLAETKAYKPVTKMNETCFYIYAAHFLFINPSKTVATMIFPSLPFAAYIAAIVINVTICLTTYYSSKKLFPKATAILSGGRIK